MRTISVRVLTILTSIAVTVTLWQPLLAAPHGKSCSWTASSEIDFYWSDSDNWACEGGSGPPSGDDDVTISAGPANAPIVEGSAAAKTLKLSGTLRISAGTGHLTIGSKWTNQGDAAIVSQGILEGNGEVTTGGTVHFLDSGTLIGDLTIDPLATASVAAVYMQGNVVNDGTLTGEVSGGQFHMQGGLFTNNGTVAVNEFIFEKGGVQNVTGNGNWSSGIEYLTVVNNTRLMPTSNVSFGPQYFSIYDNDRLDVGTHQVTFKAPVAVDGSIDGSNGGSVHTQGNGVSIGVGNEEHFTPPLIVENGVTRAYGVFSGTLAINPSGTLRVMTAPAGILVATNVVTVDGKLDGDDSSVAFVLRGPKITVNGSVAVAEVDLRGTTQQTITGTGTLNLHRVSIEAAGGVNLNSPMTVDESIGLFENLYVGSNTLITLTESAIISGENSDRDIFGRVKRLGPFQINKAYGFGNLNLGVIFMQTGTALPSAITLTLKSTPWADLPGSINRSFSLQTQAGNNWTGKLTLDYRDADLHGAEEFLQVWTRTSSAAPWIKRSYTLANFNQNWIALEGLTHFSDWGLVIKSVFIPMVKK